MSEEEHAGKELWELMGYNNPKTPTWESLKPDYRDCWIELAKKVTINN